MTQHAEFQRNHLDLDEFFSEFWRKKPCFIPGGASALLDHTWSGDDFSALRTKALAEGGSVQERTGEVTFIERVSAHSPVLAGRADDLRRTFGSPSAWFDAVRTYTAGGIGAHFDHSDNFVLQQDGVKEWSLASPHHIEKTALAHRMLNLPGVGDHELPDGDGDRLCFEVTPGDLLYIPLFWLHSGVSRAGSLSLSFVCPALSVQSALLPLLARTLKSHLIGYQPLPALHAYLSEEERADASETIRRATRALLNHMAGPDFLEAVAALQDSSVATRE